MVKPKSHIDNWMSRPTVERSLRDSLFAARQVNAFNRPTVDLSWGDGRSTGKLRWLIWYSMRYVLMQ